LPGPAGYSLAGYRGDAPREGKRGEVREEWGEDGVGAGERQAGILQF